MRHLLPLAILSTLLVGCVVNPDADKAFRDDRRRKDSIAVQQGVVEPMPDTGQYDMPVAPIGSGDMPVVNPADSMQVVPK